MLCTAKFVVGSGINIKRINTLCGQNVRIWKFKLLVRQVTNTL